MLFFFKVENYVQVCVTRWSFGHSFAGEGTPMPPAWLGNIESEKYRCWICKPTKGVFSNPDGFLQGIYTILQKIHRRFQVIHGYSQPSNLARSTSIGKSSNRTRGFRQNDVHPRNSSHSRHSTWIWSNLYLGKMSD